MLIDEDRDNSLWEQRDSLIRTTYLNVYSSQRRIYTGHIEMCKRKHDIISSNRNDFRLRNLVRSGFRSVPLIIREIYSV